MSDSTDQKSGQSSPEGTAPAPSGEQSSGSGGSSRSGGNRRRRGSRGGRNRGGGQRTDDRQSDQKNQTDKDAGQREPDELPERSIEGKPQCDWVLLDAGDIIVHVFRPEVRAFYNLEKMWSAERPNDPTTH